MGRLSMPQKRKRADDLFSVDRVWERKVEEDGTKRYLTSWKGFAEKTWEPIEHFTQDAIELVKDLERVLDDPDNNPKPQWLIDFEDQKARGVNVLKRTPGYNSKTAAASASRAASTDPPSGKRERREDSMDASRRSGRTRTVPDSIKFTDAIRRRSRGMHEDSTTPTRVLPVRATRGAVADTTPAATPPRSLDSSRASTRHGESDRAESEDEGTSRQDEPLPTTLRVSGPPEQKVDDVKEEEGPSSSSTIAADDSISKEREASALKVDVRNEIRSSHMISPAHVSPNDLPAASPASTILSASKIDSTTGILLPYEPASFPPFDWVAHIERDGGEPAPLECFWKRRIDLFVNPFGDHIGKLLKVPDYDEIFSWEWCTLGTVIATHGPWVQIHALDTDPVLAHWYMADDAGIQPFVNLTDQGNPKCKEPNKRRSTGNYKRMVERAMFDADGTDKRVPRECFENQIPWKNRPVKNYFKVGYKLETYDPIRGEGCFYPATVIEVNAAREMVKFHFDGYPESHTKTVSYNDYRLFPCGFAAAIGWKCVQPVSLFKKLENRGRKKVSITATTAPTLPAVQASPSIRPSTSTNPPNNNNEKQRKSEINRLRPTSYREASTPDEEETDEEEEDRYVSRSQPHRTRAPVIPGLMKRNEESKRQEVRMIEEKRNEEPLIKKPVRQMSPLRLRDFEEVQSSKKDSELPVTSFRYSHTGNQVLLFLNHDCNVGLNIHPSCFRLIPSKIRGSLPHVWREILQQLLNSCVDNKQFIECVPKNTMSNHQTLFSITYDDSPNSTVGHYLVPPPNMPMARELLSDIMKKAGLCRNAITFDARRICEQCKNREPTDAKVFEILRSAKQQGLHQIQQQQQQSQHHHSQQHPMQQRQLQHQLQQNHHRQAARVMQTSAPPPVARVAPSTPVTPIAPHQPPTQQVLLQPAAPAIRHAYVPAPAAPVAIEDPERFLHNRVNIKTLTENEIIEMLHALKVPQDVCDIFKRKKINWRSLQQLNEDIMVEQLHVPRVWAAKIHDFLEQNKDGL
ncbi:hypothetical protein PMAYCL1PPCAC_09859 [Pristionchus mayeri]|uniref:Chromo domain-containing protein n=1 Tax=Pristionchus mayeri TaxID=1317129 RepID=A0AAN5CEA2_9BILA|nr:hypothetical protein PMAYCL1PPCAC_09859 [Pristionchus mayeri]